MNLVKNKKIIICEVIEINKSYIVVKNKNKTFVCNESQVSDFKVDLFEYFQIGKTYKFCLINNKYISYKAVRPKLIKNKKHPIPTISGSRNLESHLLKIIKNQDHKKN